MSKSLTTSAPLSDAALRSAIGELQRNAVDMVLNTGALAIGTTKTKILVANTIYAMIDGVLVKKTTSENSPSGTVSNATFNVFVLSMTAAGTITVTMGTAGATIGAVVFPTIPDDSVVIGFVIVNPTGTGDFVGGTTDLDDATVVPNAVYVNTAYPFNPNALAL